jgi:hypothetical protein
MRNSDQRLGFSESIIVREWRRMSANVGEHCVTWTSGSTVKIGWVAVGV